jgi:long-subunit fatty acid transport protein
VIQVRTLVAVAVAVAVNVHVDVGDATAGGFGIPEIGVRRTAMGSIVGRPDDGSAIYHNPAGLILQHGWNLYISGGLSLLNTAFELHPWTDSDKFIPDKPGTDGYYKSVRPSRAYGVIPLIAATGEIIPDRLVIGLSAFVGNAQGASFSPDAVTRYHLIDGYVVAPQAVVGAAYRIAPTITLGATAGVVNIRIHGEQDVFPIINGTDVSSIVGTKPLLTLDGSAWAPTWMVGAFGQPTSRITWGATITGRVDATLHGPVDIAYSDDSARPGGHLDGTQTTNQLLPWGASAGLNVDVTPQLEIGGEARYWLYRQYKDQDTQLTGISIVSELDSPKNYHDSWEVSGGVRVHGLAAAKGLELMCGMQYDSSPAPTETVSLSSPSFTHVGVHSGLRYAWDRYRVGASYIHYWYEVPTISDSVTSPPTDIKGHGSNNIFTLSLEAKL